MSYQKLVRWMDDHRGAALDVIRTYLGGGLFARGLLFAASANGVEVLAGSDATVAALPGAVAGYVVTAHLVGGAMLTVGLYTRLAALVQIPVLVGAVFFVHLHDGLLSANQSLEFSALVLFLLIVVTAFGSGRWSADHRWLGRRPPTKREAAGA
jgi:uncharacterized membrane protein YphA (DoxX/SURF4 family)